jgi:hypothetical protein
MDAWGPEECKKRVDEIAGWFRDGQERYGWKDKLKAVTWSILTGLAFSIDPFDPFPSLIREAIQRAEKEEEQRLAFGNGYLVNFRPVAVFAFEVRIGKAVQFRGSQYAGGIFLHPPPSGHSSLKYSLVTMPATIRRDNLYFRSKVAINDGANGGAGSGQPLTFKLVVDEAVRWTSRPIQRCSDADECLVSVPPEAQTVEIQVHCPGDPYCAHAVWLDPRLVPEGKG